MDTTDPPEWGNGADRGTVRPLAADAVTRLFGTARSSRAQFEAIAMDYANPRYAEFMSEAEVRWTGFYVLL